MLVSTTPGLENVRISRFFTSRGYATCVARKAARLKEIGIRDDDLARVSYVDDNLGAGEEVQYRGNLHWIIYAQPVFFALICIAAGAWGATDRVNGQFYLAGACVVAFCALAASVLSMIAVRTSEGAITDRRVIFKTGWIKRHSVELFLPKIEAITVDQSIAGRIFNYGTISISGTGGTHGTFTRMQAPFEFRRRIQTLAGDTEEDAAPRRT